MEIGRIKDNIISNAVDGAKMKPTEGEFEKRLQLAMANNDDKEIKQACKDFEKIFLSMLYKQMKATVPKSQLFPQDASKDIYESFLDDIFVEEASKGNSFGLADVIYKELKRQNNYNHLPINELEREAEGAKEE